MSYFIVNTTVANVYREPSHKSEIITQALMGESCNIIDNNDKWYLVKQWDGYEGWIYHFHGIESNTKYEAKLILQDMFGVMLSPGKDRIISNLVFGCNVQAEVEQSGYKITLPDGRTGFSFNNIGNRYKYVSREEIVETALRFLGIPYLWGGKTPYGIDCSGLVQTVFKSCGINLPRDGYQQAEFFSNSLIRIDKIEHGDLLFFGEKNAVSHVAISTGELNFINARGYVQEESIDKNNPLFNCNLNDLFLYVVSIKNVINKK